MEESSRERRESERAYISLGVARASVLGTRIYAAARVRSKKEKKEKAGGNAGLWLFPHDSGSLSSAFAEKTESGLMRFSG